jgi:tetratricopeptide (TPR) repeat protein
MGLYQSITMLSITTVRLLFIIFRTEGTHTERRAIIVSIASHDRYAVRSFLCHGSTILTRLFRDLIQQHILPAAPNRLFGREYEEKSIITALITNRLPRIAVLGLGGMGKTSLALTVLHSPVIRKRYSWRLFLSCEGIASVEQFTSDLADTLQVPAANRDAALRHVVLQRLARGPRVLICLDNFETLWDPPYTRNTIESLLRELDGIENISLILTMRGTQRPASLRWSTLPPPLQPLSMVHMKSILLEITDTANDPCVYKLLECIGGIPLAASLLANLLRDDLETPSGLWSRWESERTSMIETGGQDRLSSLDVSIHLSIESPRMNACPSAKTILALLALLPNGFPEDSSLRSCLGENLAKKGHSYERSIQALKRVALVSVDVIPGSTATDVPQARLRLVPAIRQYCLKNLSVTNHLISALTTVYAQFITHNSDFTNPSFHPIVSPELPNLRVVLRCALERSNLNGEIIRAIADYTEWCIYLGAYSDDLIDSALYKAELMCLESSDCLYTAAKLYESRNKLDKAEDLITRAMERYRLTDNQTGEARCRGWLGRLQMRREDYISAEASLKGALEIHAALGDTQGEADARRQLGELYFREGRDEEAHEHLSRAFVLHRQAGDILGEANDLRNLGQLEMQKGSFDVAEEKFKSALTLHRQVMDVLGEAYIHKNLGVLSFEKKNFRAAEESFTRALELHRQMDDSRGEAYALRKLGELRVQDNQLGEAEGLFTRAISLHRQALDIAGEAADLQELAGLQKRMEQWEEASISFRQALILHDQLGDSVGKVYDSEQLSDIIACHESELEQRGRSSYRLSGQKRKRSGSDGSRESPIGTPPFAPVDSPATFPTFMGVPSSSIPPLTLSSSFDFPPYFDCQNTLGPTIEPHVDGSGWGKLLEEYYYTGPSSREA